ANTDLKIEVMIIPVSDVDRAKAFYTGLGWRLDADFSFPGGLRVVQVTPRLRVLAAIRHEDHVGCAQLGQGVHHRLRHRSRPQCAARPPRPGGRVLSPRPERSGFWAGS